MHYNKHYGKSIAIITLFAVQIIMGLIYIPTQSNPNTTEFNIPVNSDVAGNELYSEQINVDIAGPHSLIQQSFITNDSNAFEKIDLADPAFTGASFYIDVSNGIEPSLSPLPAGDSSLSISKISTNAMEGFLFYDNQSSASMVEVRKDRAVEILRETFGVDLIFHTPIENGSIGYYYPFSGFYPTEDVWRNYLYITTNNLPNDGYFSALNIPRLTSNEYLSTKHLSSSILYVNSFKNLRAVEIIDTDSLYLGVDLSIFDIIDELFAGLGEISSSGLLDLVGDTGDFGSIDLESLIGGMGISNSSEGLLDSITNSIFYSLIYEGTDEGISFNSEFQSYGFDLLQSMATNASGLTVTEKAFNSLLGALISGITLSIYSGEVVKTTPERLYLDSYKLDRIETLLFILGQDINISALESYSFEFGWMSSGLQSNLIQIPKNLEDDTDPINFLSLLGFAGIPIILGSLLEPLDSFNIDYITHDYDPSLYITKTIQNASNTISDSQNITITVENRGQHTVWGQEFALDELPSSIPISNDPKQASELILAITGGFVDITPIFDGMESLGYNTEDYFHNDNPRFFMIDTLGTGVYDYYYPSLNIFDLMTGNNETLLESATSILPYSPEYAAALQEPGNIASLGPIYGPLALVIAPLLENENSIYNPENWYLAPGDSFQIVVEGLDYGLLDSYHTLTGGALMIDDIQDVSPVFMLGNEDQYGSIEGTLEMNDNIDWILSSQENFDGNEEISFYSSFSNSSTLELENKTIESINIQGLLSESFSGSCIFEIFNYSSSEFDSFNIPIVNDTIINVTLSNLDYTIENYFDSNLNYTIISKISWENSETFTLHIDNLQLNLQERRGILIPSLPSRVMYSSEIGESQYSIGSNSIALNTQNAASIVGFISLNSTESYCGELVQYHLNLTNLGSIIAYNVSVSLPIPGLLSNLQNIEYLGESYYGNISGFNLVNNLVGIEIPQISPGEEVSALSFEFYVPNSVIIPGAEIVWDDFGTTPFPQSAQTNEIFISAPVKYTNSTNTPYLNSIEFEYINNFSSESPRVNSSPFIVNLKVTNTGSHSVSGLLLEFPENIIGITLKNASNQYYLESLAPNTSKIIQFEYNKTDFRGYSIPLPRIISSIEADYLIVASESPLLLGSFSLTLSKDFEIVDGEVGTIFQIHVSAQNTGSIELGNFTISDIWAYNAEGFTLVDGLMVKNVDLLLPGEQLTFTYRIIIRNKGWFNMEPAEVVYYHEIRNLVQSEALMFKARENYGILTARLYIPIFIGLVVLLATYRFKTKYNKEDLEFERRETLLFGHSLRDVAWNKKYIQEFFDEEMHTNENKSKSPSEVEN